MEDDKNYDWIDELKTWRIDFEYIKDCVTIKDFADISAEDEDIAKAILKLTPGAFVDGASRPIIILSIEKISDSGDEY